MLILTRRIGEVIKINDDISIRVLKIKGNQVHMGFVAPDDVEVHREEVYKRLQKEKKGVANGNK